MHIVQFYGIALAVIHVVHIWFCITQNRVLIRFQSVGHRVPDED